DARAHVRAHVPTVEHARHRGGRDARLGRHVADGGVLRAAAARSRLVSLRFHIVTTIADLDARIGLCSSRLETGNDFITVLVRRGVQLLSEAALPRRRGLPGRGGTATSSRSLMLPRASLLAAVLLPSSLCLAACGDSSPAPKTADDQPQ